MNKSRRFTWRNLLPVLHASDDSSMDARTLYALSCLLVLVQLPHTLNMPVWVSAVGLSLVGARLALIKNPKHTLLGWLLSPASVTGIAALSALAIKWDYGYIIGRDPCVAFLFILVAAKFAEVRRAIDATLLLCLCAFLLLTQYFYSQTIIAAIVTLPAVVALAYCLAILRDAKTPQNVTFHLKLICKLLLQGLPIAALLFFVFPRLPGPMWSLPDGTAGTTGLSDSMSPGSIGKLSQSGAVAFRVEFDGDTPEPSQLYWRGIVLSQFNGRSWSTNDQTFAASTTYFDSVQSQAAPSIDYTVTLPAHQMRWLFALDAASSQPTNYNASGQADALDSNRTSRPIGTVLADGQIQSRNRVTQPLRYRQSSSLSDVIPAMHAPRADTVFLPEKNTRAIRFAKELRARTSSDREYAKEVLRHFNQQPFRYTLEPQLLGSSPVDEFLFDTQEGFCEHYASAFVVLMRAVGIPARIVTGYQGGEINNDYLIVRQANAHAWAEVYLDGVWQRADPTAAVAPSRVEQGLAAALPNEAAVPRMSHQTPGLIRNVLLRWDTLNYHWQRLVIDFDDDSQQSFWDAIGLGKAALWQISVIALLIIGLWSAWVIGLPRWPHSRLQRQERHWNRLVKTLNANSLSREHAESASEFLQRACEQWPSCTSRFMRLEVAFERLRFQAINDQQQKELSKQLLKDIVWLQFNLPFRRRAVLVKR